MIKYPAGRNTNHFFTRHSRNELRQIRTVVKFPSISILLLSGTHFFILFLVQSLVIKHQTIFVYEKNISLPRLHFCSLYSVRKECSCSKRRHRRCQPTE